MSNRIIEGTDSEYCWQYDIRKKNQKSDLEESGFSQEYVDGLSCGDFDFTIVTDLDERAKMKAFIERHEWLGNLSQYTTHWFATYHKGQLAGVVLMNVPNSFSKMLGENTPQLERLLSRGACVSWSPKNLASRLITQSIEWMVHNTDYRLFTAYSDPNAGEIGTIYSACNFYYLGQKSGTTTRYINPYTGKIVSDRFFRQRSAYRKYAEELGIAWQKNWTSNTGMLWDNVPDNIEKVLRDFSKKKQAESQKFEFPPKHKYCYILGVNKKETRQLRKEFFKRNKVYPYPKRIRNDVSNVATTITYVLSSENGDIQDN
jgi:hypothetical protein